jgi:hypothetical protein
VTPDPSFERTAAPRSAAQLKRYTDAISRNSNAGTSGWFSFRGRNGPQCFRRPTFRAMRIRDFEPGEGDHPDCAKRGARQTVVA